MQTNSRRYLGVWGCLIGLALALGAATLGCGDDNPIAPAAPGSTVLTGIFAGDSAGGAITLTVETRHLTYVPSATRPGLSPSGVADVVDIRGVLTHESGETDSLSGSYDRARNSLDFTGGGFHFTGGLALATKNNLAWASGYFSDSTGGGTFLCLPGAPPYTQPYCGTFRSDSSSTTGRWNFAVRGDSLVGFAAAEGWEFTLGFYGILKGSGTERIFRSIAGAHDATHGNITFYWMGAVNTTEGSASGTWTGFFFDGAVVREDGTWSAAVLVP